VTPSADCQLGVGSATAVLFGASNGFVLIGRESRRSLEGP
jgi:hypothetical protein